MPRRPGWDSTPSGVTCFRKSNLKENPHFFVICKRATFRILVPVTLMQTSTWMSMRGLRCLNSTLQVRLDRTGLLGRGSWSKHIGTPFMVASCDPLEAKPCETERQGQALITAILSVQIRREGIKIKRVTGQPSTTAVKHAMISPYMLQLPSV